MRFCLGTLYYLYRHHYHHYTPEKPQPPVPIKDVRVEVLIADFCASVTIHQTFVNVEEQPIEAVYVFPLDEKAAITSFEARIDGKKIKGVIQEKEEARATYDDAIASGHGAYKLEEKEDEPNVFSVEVGNLPPGQEATISITYTTELTFVEGLLQFRLPLTNDNPSYFAAKRTDFNVPQLKLTAKLEMTSNIRTVSSTSHPVSFEFGEEPTQGVVTLQPSTTDPVGDFVLLVKLAKPHQPCTRVGVNEKGNKAIMMSLYPDLELGDDDEVYTEMVFLVDRSYSMAGPRINQVKATLDIFLRSLSPGTLFNIIGFGSRTQHLFKSGSVEYNDTNLEIASKYVREMKADLDGTDVLKPLKEVLQTKPRDGYPRQLFILTDGQVTNTIECVEFVRKHADTTRVFTFGIGNDASPELVRGLARAGEGFFELVRENEPMEEKVMRQLNRAMQPALTNISFLWKGIKVRQSPHRLPPLFAGGRVIIYAFPQDDQPQTGQVEVVMRAKTGNKPFVCSVKIDLDNAKPGDLIHKLAAKSTLKDLAEGRSYFHSPKGDLVPGRNVASEAIRLSLEHGVMSKLTAFVAVEERENPTEGSMQLRKIPITVEKAAAYEAKRKQQIRVQEQREAQKAWHVNGPKVCSSSSSSSSTITMPEGLEYSIEYDDDGGCSSGEEEELELCRSSGPALKNKQFKSKKRSEASEDRRSSLSALKKPSGSVPPPPSPSCMPPPPPGCLPPPARKGGLAQTQQTLAEKEESGVKPTAVSVADTDAVPHLAAPATPTPASPPELMRRIIAKQKASGTWTASDVADLLQIPLEQLTAAAPASATEELWATAVASAYLVSRFADHRVTFELVVRKATKHVARSAKSLGPDAAAIDWHQLAVDFVASLPRAP